MADVTVSDRTPADLSACVELLKEVYAEDDYPAFWPEDPAAWIANGRELHGWVARSGDTVVGHVGMHGAIGDLATPTWCDATGREPEELGIVARLFVSAKWRGMGLGTLLLNHAVAHIRREGRLPVMDVAVAHAELISFYESRGWHSVGDTSVWMPNGIPFTVRALVSP